MQKKHKTKFYFVGQRKKYTGKVAILREKQKS